jgi:small subunit ribosomal protein S5
MENEKTDTTEEKVTLGEITPDIGAEPNTDVDSTSVNAEDVDTRSVAHGSGPHRGFSGGGRGDVRRGRDRGRDRDREPVEKEFVEKLVKLNRTAKVVKGGRRFSFSALTVIGDRKGNVGYGFGKANDVSEAIRKSVDKAKRNMIRLPVKNGTIPHEVMGYFKASQVLLKPACSGTGIIAGGPVRAIMEAGGITDVLSKSIGASSQFNVVKATFDCISKMMDARTIAKNRGKSMKELWG